MQWAASNRMPVEMSATRLAAGFIAGFVAVFTFHQWMLALLHAVGFTAARPYVLTPVPPFDVPRVVSLAFWGGVWGIIFTLVERRFPRGLGYWIAAIVCAAAALSLVAWFVVAPLKGLPLAAGGHPAGLITGLLVNGAWGLGTALLFHLMLQITPASATQPGR